MLEAPAAYAPALRGPHRRVSYVTSRTVEGTVLAQDVKVADGQVSANLSNRVTRSATFTLPDTYYPDRPDDPFSPYLAVVHIRSGIALGNGTEITFPVFTGRVYAATLRADGAADFRADDLAADVVAARFEQPMVSSVSPLTTYVAEIERLISDAVPQALFGVNPDSGQRIPRLVWDEDRGKALDDLAAAIGCRWYAQGDGTFVVRPIAYGPATVVREFLDGPAGLLSAAEITRTRDGSANSIVTVSERLDGSDPVRVVKRDTRPTSPTRFGGLFGKVVQVVKLQTPQTQNEANAFSSAQLAASVALTEQWSSTVVADHTVEPGDTVRLRYRGRVADQIVDSVAYPLGLQPMRLGSRGAVRMDDVGA